MGIAQMILLDTHVLIWWVNGSSQLPQKTLSLIEKNKAKNTLAVSSMSFWEVAMLYKRGRLTLNYDLDTWIGKVTSLPFLEEIPPNHDIFAKSVMLENFKNEDPADRIIVATTLNRGATLVTKDEKILKYPAVQSCWVK